VSTGHPPAATVVLVHGIFHGSWCWQRVTDLLSSRGIAALAVDRRRGRPKRVVSSLKENAELVEATLRRIDGPVVLVGHSAGCRMITEAGLHPSVRHLVYIAGLMPGPPEDPLAPPQALPQPSFQLADGSWAVTADVAQARFFTELDPATARWAAAQLSPQAPPFPDPADHPTSFAWQERPSTYVLCAKDATVHPDLQREVARRATRAVTLQSGHSPFLSHPQVLADLLGSLARGAVTPRGR
jgi:pimeloyl-ACP methyl ester carboxylesterase